MYDESSIISLGTVEFIRTRPCSRIENTGVSGIFHILKEIIDNSLDEIENFNISSKNGEVVVTIFRDKIIHKYILIVCDNGRGIPHGKIKDVFTKERTSGKFNSNEYIYSSGLFGSGACVTFSLSEILRAITFSRNIASDICISYDSFKDKQPITDNNPIYKSKHGTIIAFIPDSNIFDKKGMELFATEGIKKIEELFKTIAYFNSSNYRLMIKLIDIDNKFSKFKGLIFNKSTIDTYKFITSLTDQSNILFDSNNFNDKLKRDYVQDCFQLSLSNQNYIGSIKKESDIKNNDYMQVNIDLYSESKYYNQSNCVLSLINNVLFKSVGDTHIATLTRVLKNHISKYIKDKNLKEFFLKHYVLSLYYIANIKYKWDDFVGTTKSKFKDNKFRIKYLHFLNEYFSNNNNIIFKIYDIIKNDLNNKFRKVNIVNSSRSAKLMIDLNFPAHFDNCRNYQNSELFICEGLSAKVDKARDAEFQALYALRGKPFNSVISENKREESLNKILSVKLFQDIFKLLNVNPLSNDLSKLRFKKIFIMADADEHGKHITNLVIGNMFIYNPNLLYEGHIYLVIPPLYKIKFGKSIMFAKNQDEFIASLAMNLYSKIIDIYIAPINKESKTKLKLDEFIYFIKILNDVGFIIRNYSEEFNINPVVLELLIRNIDLLWNINVDLLQKKFKTDSIKYDRKYDILFISYEDEDMFIPLFRIRELIQNKLFPIYSQYSFELFDIIVDNKIKKHSAYRMTPIQLFFLLNNINDKIQFERLKGLGNMLSEDLYNCCINVETRSTFQIKDMENIENIYKYLGKDPIYRRALIKQ